MSTRHLVDPEIAPVIKLMALGDLTREGLPELRAAGALRFAAAPQPDPPAQQMVAPGRDGAPDVPLLVYNAGEPGEKRGALLHIHGGGMVMGSAEMSRMSLPALCAAHGAVGVSVEYRLAPETPFPGPQEDCYAALDWLVANAERLGVDAARIVVMGESAGGGLAAALAQMVHDRGEHRLAGQLLTYPMLDWRTGGADCVWNNPTVGEFVWTRERNRFGWECLRGDYSVNDARKGWFSPSLADDLSGLPPMTILTGSLDLFFDENLDYARRLCAGGTSVDLHVYPGAIHGFQLAADAAVSKAAARDLMAAAGRLLGG